MKKIALLLTSVLILSFSSLSIANTKIGVLDVNKVLASIPQIKNMQTELKKKFDPRGRQVINLQNSFQKDITKYRQNNNSLKGDVLKTAQEKLINENKRLQETRLTFQKDLVAAQNQSLQPILRQIESIANSIATKQKFDLIVTKTSTVFNKPGLEITNQVIAEMKKLVATKDKKKKQNKKKK